MPFLRQAHGVKLHRIPNNVVLYSATVRFASHSNKHKKNHVARDPQAKVRPDHNEAGNGKRQKPFWKSIAPDFLTQETNASSAKNGHFAQVSAFKLYASHKLGSKPIVEASSASWDSKSNEVSHTVYDPISGRMVPVNNGQTRQTSTSSKSKKDNHIPDKTYQKPFIVSQLPENIEALSNTPTTHASFTEYFDKTYQSEHDELFAARRHLDTLREQIQILERQTHPELTKPHYAVDAERPAVFEDGWDNIPQGLQTAFKLEKEACEHGTMEPLEQEMDALNKRPAQEVNDSYSIAPSGMETLFANEQRSDDISHQSSLEQELVAMNTKAPPVDDGYSPSPQGLETLFEQEQQSADKSLEDEVRMTGSATGQPQYIDDFAKETTGLETIYQREQQGTPQRLEHELEDMASNPAVSDLGDVYSTEPSGMQTLYEREVEGRQKKQYTDLEHELHDHIQALDDYSSAKLDGMQTLWKQEQKDVEKGSARSLEEEIKAKQQPQVISNEHGTSPFGMENHFRNEAQSTEDGKSRTLEEEISHRVQTQIHDEDHSRSLKGLETAFQAEEKDAILGKRQSLEKDIGSREPGFEDGYSTMPVGLQMMFHREKQSGGRSLEEDLKQMEEASYHEDGYSRAPIGMENSFERETKDESASLETDLKDIPGEGDLSPTVGKFAARDQWYKQPARSTFSEEFLKADVKELDQHTPVLGRSLNEGSSTAVKPSVPSPETTTATEHLSTTAAPINDSINSSLMPGTSPNITWAEPALYKVIAYDSSKDIITITTTPSNFSNSEAPLSIPQAISKLAQTARFLPHLASAQNEGFQVIHAECDYLILRKVEEDSQPRAPRYDGDINPIDGTARCIPIEPPTSRFASPTGFVNYEPIFPTETIHKRKEATSPSSDIPTNGHPEFKQQTYYPKSPLRAQLRGNRGRVVVDKFRKEKRRRWRRRVVWVLSVAAGTAVCTTYTVGVSQSMR